MTSRTPSKPRVVFRPVHGIVLLDKDTGPSSNAALQQIRFALRAQKGGHTGALDPLASGMLPLCFGEASKIAGYLLGNDKAYETVARLGVVTDTDDAQGVEIRRRAVPAFDREQLIAHLATLTGDIQQTAPIYSALKQGGEPLYAKARRGEPVEAPTRRVQVRSIEVLDVGDDWVRLRIECGTGTYIRSIVRDLGELLGCGAHVESLRRLWVAPFRNVPMWTAAQLLERLEQGREDEVLLPITAGLSGWTQWALNTDQVRALSHGKAVHGAFGPAGDGLALAPTGQPLGLVTADQAGTLRAKRLFAWVGDVAAELTQTPENGS